jgi:hypothetical protein
MSEDRKLDRNVYGSNKPASEDRPEPNIRDTHSPEQIDAEVRIREIVRQEKLEAKSDSDAA